MDGKSKEERQRIFTRKVIQKLYNVSGENNAPVIHGKKKISNTVNDDDENHHIDEPAAKIFKSDTAYEQKQMRTENSSSGSGIDCENTDASQKKTAENVCTNDKLSPYLSDDEDSEETSSKKRKRKRRHRNPALNPRTGNRSSSSSSTSSYVQNSQITPHFPEGSSLQLSRNQRRKLKRKRREKKIKNEEKNVGYTYKSII